ncbi:MAG: cytochrome c3 family protein [Candidatus Schekmanbacteria bacterium]|nr:cytochrome c3 family protein [Candidatus Schekmanbacteria bacterium]
MKSKLSVVCLSAVVALATVSIARAEDDVTSTKHNMRNLSSLDATAYGSATDHGEVCVYCHTPHNKNTSVEAPLWNRQVNTSGYTVYSSTTIDMTIDSQPTGVSLACLSCHDGTIGLDVIVNQPGDTYSAPSGTTMRSGNKAGGTPPVGDATFRPMLTQDLSDDHPVSVTYDPAIDVKFNSVASITSAGLRLFSGKVQCATCHNPHESDTAKKPFLRIANGNSALCKTCHIK